MTTGDDDRDRRVVLIGRVGAVLCALSIVMAVTAWFTNVPPPVSGSAVVVVIFSVALGTRLLRGRHFPENAVVVSRPWKWVMTATIVGVGLFMIVGELVVDPIQIARVAIYPLLAAASLTVFVERAPTGKPVRDMDDRSKL